MAVRVSLCFYRWSVLLSKRVRLQEETGGPEAIVRVNRREQLPTLMCPLCNLVEETVSHLFVKCKIAFQIWSMVSKWVGLHIIYHNDMKHHLIQFGLFQFNVKRSRAWKGNWVAVIWSI